MSGQILDTLKQKLIQVAIGFLLILAAPVGQFYNEQRVVHIEGMLNTLHDTCIENISPDSVVSDNEGRCVHMTGQIKSDSKLIDAEFKVSLDNGLCLKREAEMYQWSKTTKTKKDSSGNKTKKTVWKKKWSSKRLSNSDFTHKNPEMLYKSQEWCAKEGDVHLGKFDLNAEQIKAYGGYTELAIDPKVVNQLTIPNISVPKSNRIYIARSATGLKKITSTSGNIGDHRLDYSQKSAGEVSLLAIQHGKSFSKIEDKDGYSLNIISSGIKSKEVLISEEHDHNVMISWLFRIGGLILIWTGVGLVFSPLTAISNRVPIVGALISGGVSIFGLLIAIIISGLAISIGWIFAHPLVGGGLLAIVIAAIIGLFVLRSKNLKEMTP